MHTAADSTSMKAGWSVSLRPDLLSVAEIWVPAFQDGLLDAYCKQQDRALNHAAGPPMSHVTPWPPQAALDCLQNALLQAPAAEHHVVLQSKFVMPHVVLGHLQAFLEGLLDAYCKQLQQAGSSQTAPAGLAVLLAAAAVELLRGHGLLADHAVKLGYMDKLVKVLAARVPARPAGEAAC